MKTSEIGDGIMRASVGAQAGTLLLVLGIAASCRGFAQTPAPPADAASAQAQDSAAPSSSASRPASTPVAAPSPSLIGDAVPTVVRKKDLHRSSRHQCSAPTAQFHQHQERQARRWGLPGLRLPGGGGQPGDDPRRASMCREWWTGWSAPVVSRAGPSWTCTSLPSFFPTAPWWRFRAW